MGQKVIKPYHLFNYQENWYIVNIEEMSAHTVTDNTAGLLKKITSADALSLNPFLEEELKKLGLLSEGGKKTPKVRKKIKRQQMPVVNMSLFLSQSCNLKCVYCYGEGGEYGTGGNLNEKTAFQAVDWFIEQSGIVKKLHIGFFGGEPFLKFPLMKATVAYAQKRAHEMEKDITFSATTNGTLLDDEKIDYIKEHMSVMISFDGLKELQDTQRPYADGRGSYDSTVPKIKKLLEVLPETFGHAVIVGNTPRELVKNAMEEIGFSNVTIMPASRSLFTDESDNTKPVRDTSSLIREMEDEAGKWIDLTKKRDSEALKILRDRGALYKGMISLLHNIKRYHPCGAGRELAAVSCSGDIYLCHRFVGREKYKLGSIFDSGLKREEYQRSPLIGNKVCSDCFARYYCAGGCRHDNASACGSIATPSEDMCRIRCCELELAAAITSSLGSEDRTFLIEQEIFPAKPCLFDFV